jgi:hypothetical protein
MNGPTDAQIVTVQTNLTNMQSLNDYIYDHGQAVILNAYLLLSEQDNVDPSAVVLLNMLEGVYWAIGSELGPLGNFAASFLSGMTSSWTANTPPDLNTQFASYVTRFSATTTAVDSQLAVYKTNTAANWTTAFTNPFTHQSTSVGDLANDTLPDEGDPAFEAAATAAVHALDLALWTQMLQKNCVVTLFEPSGGFSVLPGDEHVPPVQWAEGFYQRNPAYYVTWSWQKGGGCGDAPRGWQIEEYNLGRGASTLSDGSLSGGACNYLFQDSVPGTIINPNGLFTRQDVFTKMELKQKSWVVANAGAATAQTVSRSYLRANKQGRSLSALIAHEGRTAVEQRIVTKARDDPAFYYELQRRPRAAIERVLDVQLPENVDFRVIVENPSSFGLVVPYAGPGTAAPSQVEGAG